MPTAIEFNHVSKQYRLGLVSTKTLSHDLQRWWTMNIRGKEDPYLKIGETNDRSTKGSSDYVWALKDIDFKVEQGDVVGIIGKNGAGKSTLLKLLSKVTGPTTGSIKARGRIGALLEVGTGFHSEMTGRENIFLNGAILGMSKHEIASKLDEIVDFSGCERYLDTPVKRYSSGMMVRLGFAVAAHLDPEILVVDEVLAVGDAEFQKKAIGKMQDVSKGEGRTVLFVSHNMGSVKAFCKSGILLDKGRVAFMGGVNETVERYIASNFSPDDAGTLDGIFKVRDKQMEIYSVRMNGRNSAACELVYPDRDLTVEVDGHICGTHCLDLEMIILSRDDVLLARYSPGLFNGTCQHLSNEDFHLVCHVRLPEGVANGDYHINLYICHPQVQVFASTQFPICMRMIGNSTESGLPINQSLYGFQCLG